MSVDPGVEQDRPSATFVCESDQFFDDLNADRLADIRSNHQWNIIFIDGLHLADQVYRDIIHSIAHITKPGFVLLHDVNPESWHTAHSDYTYYLEHGGMWNGTAWKAFYHARTQLPYECYTVNTDQGIGVIQTHTPATPVTHNNHWYEYGMMSQDRSYSLGLISVEEFLQKHQRGII